jgi:T5SS/PEP-CTERM-associated repeat protein
MVPIFLRDRRGVMRQKTYAAIMKMRGLAVAICLALIPCLHAESFRTNIVDGIATNAGPQLTVGATGPNNFLLVTNGGRLTNGSTIVGDAAGADTNSIVVTGTNSLWETTGSFLLGNTGALNQVSVLNGARLRSYAITVGNASSSNQLNVRDAIVTDGWPEGGNITIGAWSNANFNVVTLDGPGARGTNDRTFVGFRGASNSLIILNGAEFQVGGAPRLATDPELGVGTFPFSHGNSVEISGAGSKLTVLCPFYMGESGSGNRLLVDGARLKANLTQIGYSCGSHNNAALIRGVGAVWTNTILELGSCGVSNSLTITDGAQLLCSSFTSSFGSGGRNKIEISRPGSLLRAAVLWVGRRGTHNVLLVTDGGRVEGDSAVLGAISDDNFALVSGAGSVWSNLTMRVGDSGQRNALRVSEAALVQSTELTIGRRSDARENAVELTGDGTKLSVSSNLNIGGFGHSNRFLVSDGARAEAGNIHLGASSLASPDAAGPSHWNLLSATGTDSRVITSNLVVGFQGSSNRLEVLDGAQLDSLRAVIGDDSGTRNSALVSGSSWITTNELVVGRRATGSSLIISNGGFVRSDSGYVGEFGQFIGGGTACDFWLSGSSVHVTGPDSLWAVAGSLTVGYGAIANSLLITNGGRVFARELTIGVSERGLLSDPRCVQGAGFVNQVEIAGGDLHLDMNAVNTFEVRCGTLRLRSGAVRAGQLLMTNQWSRLELLGGSLTCSEAVVDNRLPLVIGDGLHNASFHGGNIFAPRGIVVREHAVLESLGRISANVTNFGTVSPFLFDTLVANNFVQQPKGNLLINVGVERSSALTVSNAGLLDGKLLLRRSGDLPSNTNVTILGAAAISGVFNNVTNGGRLKTTDNLGSFIVEYTATAVILRDYQSIDLDGDMIEDAWATAHFGHSPLTPAQKAADDDDDGSSNYDEFVAGTDPKNSASALRASISYANGGATVAFSCQEGKRYNISWSSDLITWNHVLEPTLSFAEPGVCRWNDDGRSTGGLGGPARFFRVSVE